MRPFIKGKLIKSILLASVIVFLCLNLGIYFYQNHLIYRPTKETPELSNYDATDMQIVTLHTKDRLTLHAWYKPANTQGVTLLYLHGNAGNIGGRMTLARQFLNAGLGLLLVEYRGYGGNKGTPTEEGLIQDARAGLQFLLSQGIPLDKIALYGESLGSGVATKLATENTFCTVILQSPYTSLIDLSHYHYPWIWIKPRDRFDSLAKIQAVHAPLLILHGIKDDVVPYSQGKTLFQHANEPKKMISFTIKGHNNIWNSPGFAKNVLHFINDHCQNN